MNEKIYIRLDVDNVGEKIELNLLNNEFEKAQDIHDCIQLNIRKTLEKIKEFSSKSLLMVGCDDILFSINKIDFDINFFESLRKNFHTQTGLTISIGIGITVQDSLFNLRIAKLSGKNKMIIKFSNLENLK